MSDWRQCRVGDLARLINGFPFDANLFGTEGAPLVRIRDLDKTETQARFKGEYLQSVAVTDQDVLIGMDGDFNVGRWRGLGPALLNQRMLALRGSPDMVSFLEYALPDKLRQINELTYSTTVKHLSSGQVRGIRVTVPGSAEHLRRVIDYLDHETTEIDAFITDQEELIALLEERRVQSLAQHFEAIVMPQKASARFGRFVSERDVRLTTEGNRLLSVSIHRGVEPAGRGDERAPLGYKAVRSGDIVLNRMRAFQGAVGFSRFDGGVSPDYAVLTAASGVDGQFVGVMMRSRPFVARMTSILRGIGGQESGVVRTPRVNVRDLANLEIDMPDLASQRMIVDRVRAADTSVDGLIADVREAIALSRERRAALVSAAVTGQIDVTEKKRVLV